MNDFYFSSRLDYLGKGELGTVVRAYPNGDLNAKPVALKIVRKSRLKGVYAKQMK